MVAFDSGQLRLLGHTFNFCCGMMRRTFLLAQIFLAATDIKIDGLRTLSRRASKCAGMSPEVPNPEENKQVQKSVNTFWLV